MKRAILAMAVFALCPITLVQAEQITYNLNNYSALQNGWTLNGTITIGNEFAWQYTISNGVTSFFATSSTPGSFAQLVNVTVTPTQILLAAPNGFTGNQFGLFGINQPGVPYLTSELLYDRDNTGQSPEQDFYRQYARPDFFTSGYSWTAYSENSSNLSLDGDPWVIATAQPAVALPEPASLTLVGIGIAFMAGYGWRRRKQLTDSTL